MEGKKRSHIQIIWKWHFSFIKTCNCLEEEKNSFLLTIKNNLMKKSKLFLILFFVSRCHANSDFRFSSNPVGHIVSMCGCLLYSYRRAVLCSLHRCHTAFLYLYWFGKIQSAEWSLHNSTELSTHRKKCAHFTYCTEHHQLSQFHMNNESSQRESSGPVFWNIFTFIIAL